MSSFPDEDGGVIADDRLVPAAKRSVVRVELVLRLSDSDDDVWLHTRRLAIGDVIQAGTRSWRAVAEESPTHVGIDARDICSPA
jgi:hypothetical protein